MLFVCVGPWGETEQRKRRRRGAVGRRWLCPLRSITTLHNKSYGALVQRPMNGYVAPCLWSSKAGRCGVQRRRSEVDMVCVRGPESNKTDPWCRITDLHKSAAKAFMIESLLCVVTTASLHCDHQCVCWPHGALTMAESVLSNDLCCCCCAGQFSFLSFLILRKENGHLDHFGLQDHQPTIVLCHASS